ncbi:phthalate 3,4-dioxygenase, ferredoxin reductase subunit [Modestobacter sp. DSM 44400]|uniref:NAD(P)/FAD-dependent oxidoreductase n=1 Tax=Modestobacter sp. DSM 44400 TaxID=1550230 RepID=UPI000894C837|nr:FAD-dependent oxidoreductase [Modestobacter sp. DSM 44400]SDY69079.1 phthalate 3,4-dioxygenase, ferredoxin reductase subunit [Modestobacter sp. DSM 44400]
MTPPGTVVVVGSSVAGVRCVQALRSEGFSGRVVLVGEETQLPYDKPPLSKQFLAGFWDTARVALLTAERAAELDVELRLGSAAERLDLAGRQVHLADGSTLAWDAAVLATGAAARPSPWHTDSGVHVVRTLADAQALRADLDTDAPVVVVGGGFIGAEVAATAHSLGRDVTVVDPLAAPIGRVVGAEVGQYFTALHQRHGVQTRFGVGVESVSGSSGDLVVVLTDGTELPAGTVIVGIGATPNDGWLADSGLLVENGVTCDEHCRAVDAPDVYAVGDLARWLHPSHDEHVRVEHWTNAVDSAVVAAHNIVHPDDLRAHAPVEYVWSDQYDWKIQIVGRPATATRHELIGSWEGTSARGAAVYTDVSGQLRGAVTVNWPKALVLCRRLLMAGTTFGEAMTQLNALPAAVAR